VNWNQTYTFDRYGNRNFNESLTTTLPIGDAFPGRAVYNALGQLAAD